MGNIIVGVLMVIAGASGQFSLRGTGSSGALIVFGVVLIFVGIFRLVKSGSESKREKERKEFLEKLVAEVKSFKAEGRSNEEITGILLGRGLKSNVVEAVVTVA